jgi:hypothetical protein
MQRAMVTGGAASSGCACVIGSLAEGWEVLCFDSLLTGSTENPWALRSRPTTSLHLRWWRALRAGRGRRSVGASVGGLMAA